jgi:hypothetical protein
VDELNARDAVCRTCRAFNRAEPLVPRVGDMPMQAQCRRTAPPWSTVSETDWCLAHQPTRVPVADDGA